MVLCCLVLFNVSQLYNPVYMYMYLKTHTEYSECDVVSKVCVVVREKHKTVV